MGVGQIRPDEKLLETINYIRAQYIMNNKRPPTIKEITRAIAKRIKKEDLLYEEFVRF